MTQHTPTPWELVLDGERYFSVIDACGDVVLPPRPRGHERPYRLIVRAVNTRDKLVEALERVRIYVVSQNNAEGMLDGLGPRQPRRSDPDLALVDEALLLTRGETEA